ncbi:response regulator [Sulfurimonas sp. MAG313]|nr:hybrid sensor histidine kinase/response regulator [Sulfurimonas sp. MAG313]MDF1880663.1 response regulator [Sulfurimonas sp. MAG313]
MKQSILIIDDSKLINNSLAKSLQERGFEIVQAFDVATAKEILLERSFNYALLDLVLPDGDGEVLLPFLQIHEEIRVIVMTSDRDADRRKHIFSFGVVIDYITKERHFDEMELSIVQLIQRISTNKSLTILLVDDSNFMRTHLRILLSKRGFKVLDASDGKDALLVMKAHKIDAAIIDLEMPIMDGNQLIGAIRKDKSKLLMPIMVVSGTNDPIKIARVIKNGVNDFIKKPYVNEEFLLKVDKMMDELKQQRLIKIHEAKFEMYNRAIDEATIFFKLNKDYKISYANSSLCAILAKGLEIKEETCFEDYLNDDGRKNFLALKEKLNKGDSYQEIFVLQKDKHLPVHLRLTFTALKDYDNEVVEILVIGFDVSLLQQKEVILQKRVDVQMKKNWEQNRLLIQQSKMASMGEMIGHIGHQWRQPLNSLSLMFQKLNHAYQKNKLSPELMNRSTKKAMRIISQMSETIDDFRDFFSENKTIESCEVSDILRHVVDIIGPTLKANNIALNLRYKEKVSIPCLKNELSQVLLNIISNAKDALVQNNIKDPEILITIKPKKEDIFIIIDDNAGGIDESIIKNIFEPYFTTKQQDNGTGIGLYMSKTIIENHMRGKLRVYNTLSGASFKITLPMYQE